MYSCIQIIWVFNVRLLTAISLHEEEKEDAISWQIEHL